MQSAKQSLHVLQNRLQLCYTTQIYLNPSCGAVVGKTRPVLIVQNQALIDINHPSTLIVPLTTNLISHAEPLRIRISARDKLEKNSDLLIDQLLAIDNLRFVSGPLMKCDSSLMQKIYQAIFEVLGGVYT